MQKTLALLGLAAVATACQGTDFESGVADEPPGISAQALLNHTSNGECGDSEYPICGGDCPAEYQRCEVACPDEYLGEECEYCVCRGSGCGDGILDEDAGEECDPGHKKPDGSGYDPCGGCTEDCKLQGCGDGEIQDDAECGRNENCDNGSAESGTLNHIDDDACRRCRTQCDVCDPPFNPLPEIEFPVIGAGAYRDCPIIGGKFGAKIEGKLTIDPEAADCSNNCEEKRNGSYAVRGDFSNCMWDVRGEGKFSGTDETKYCMGCAGEESVCDFGNYCQTLGEDYEGSVRIRKYARLPLKWLPKGGLCKTIYGKRVCLSIDCKKEVDPHSRPGAWDDHDGGMFVGVKVSGGGGESNRFKSAGADEEKSCIAGCTECNKTWKTGGLGVQGEAKCKAEASLGIASISGDLEARLTVGGKAKVTEQTGAAAGGDSSCPNESCTTYGANGELRVQGKACVEVGGMGWSVFVRGGIRYKGSQTCESDYDEDLTLFGGGGFTVGGCTAPES